MRILAIRGKNLASLADDFEVDFTREPLAGAGLFAISGPTGSGKSTLLDALCLALYGATPRLAQASGAQIPDVENSPVTPSDPRTLLRRGKGEGYAEVDFVGSDDEAYRARWAVRRARAKRDGRLQGVETLLTRIDDGQAVAGTLKTEVHAAIVRLVGLSFSQFTRAVLLAQNDFATFLKADDNERAELLQTLTGTERFERLSMRIYERAVREKASLDDLNRQLAGDPPLADAARQQLELDLAAARTATVEREKQKQALEAAQRWHQELAKLEATRNQAAATLEQAGQARAGAADRRHHLARVEAVAPARPLLETCRRLNDEAVAGGEKCVLLDQKRSATAQALEAASRAQVAARQDWDAASLAEKAAQPELDAARQLDSEIQTLVPQEQEATQALAAALRDLAAHQTEQQKLAEQQAATQRLHTEAGAWLERHKTDEALATQWLRWDYLFDQAAKTHAQQEAAQADLIRRQGAETEARESVAHQAQELGRREAERQAAASAQASAEQALAQFNPDILAQQKTEAETRRDALATAQASWSQLEERRREHAEVARETTALQAARQATARTLDNLTAQRPGLEGQLRQAERALLQAQAACGQNVDSLRAGLLANEPCPVCGAAEHPYAEAGASHRLRELLKAHQDDHDTLQKAHIHLNREEAGSSGTLQAQDRELGKLATRLADLETRLHAAQSGWAQAQRALALPETEEIGPWLQANRDANALMLRTLAGQENELGAARKARDTAQAALARALQTEQQARVAGQKTRDALQLMAQAVQTTQQQVDQTAGTLAAQLGELDPVLATPNWQATWRQAPAAFHLARKEAATAWLAQRRAREEQARKLDELAGQLKSNAGLLAKAGEIEAQQRLALERKTEEIQTRRQARLQQLGGKTVAAVVAELAGKVSSAQTAATAADQVMDRRRDEATATNTAHSLAVQSLDELKTKLARADADRAAWLAEFNVGAAAALDLAELDQLLTLAPAWLTQERAALEHLDKAVAQAEAVLKALQAQLESHHSGWAADADDGETVARKLAELAPQLATEKAAEMEKQMALKRDDERRTQAASLVETLRAQTATCEVWAKLNDLLGSADGRKFRRIAQQYTLDVLLGYANRHLAALSRRYRLERLTDSLTLLVVDLDLGDERRSVHTLSGGESFLVSLALALGLASLSSHSVRVESLFIDEGFGSLDADTLAVAMNALDNLQTQGRKVGVISHVHEMAERIGVQIQVRPQSGGQSRLTVVG